ncbi:MAG: RIP metalloprotease RseP [Candidatus Binatia bacterium]
MVNIEGIISIAYTIGWAVIALGILIVFHELGHFVVAKFSGVGVLTFSVGFGPKLWVKKVGETEYALSAFPLGGYVKMVGEDPGEEVKETDIARSFFHQGLGKRIAIVAAGPVFNLLLAVVVISLNLALFGAPALTSRVGDIRPDFPAGKAGLLKGDLIVAVDGQPINKWEELSNRIKESRGKALRLGVQRENRELEFTVQPKKSEGKNIFGEQQEFWVIGITADDSEIFVERIPPWQALGQGFYKTGEFSVLTLVVIYKMMVGDVSPKNLGGPVLIAQMAGQQAQRGMGSFFFFVAILSVNLGVLNLLPIPVLDGGHLLFFLIEAIIGRPVELKNRERAQQVGLFILIFVMIYAFYNDIARFFN